MLVERVLTEISIIISFVLTKRVCSMNIHDHRVAVPGNDINIRYGCLVRGSIHRWLTEPGSRGENVYSIPPSNCQCKRSVGASGANVEQDDVINETHRAWTNHR